MKRILTAAILAPTIAWVVLAAPPWLFFGVVIAVSLLSFYEYSGLVKAYGYPAPGPVAYAAGVLMMAVPGADYALLTLLALILLTIASSRHDLSMSLPYTACCALGLLYIFGAWKCAIGLRSVSPWWLFFALVINWVGDSAAYYAGRNFGRHKLAPSVSPKKTWEGTLASLLVTLVLGVIYIQWRFPQFPLLQAALVAMLANAAGQVGDLAESALKRGAGVKDSGNILPGHGGWLDRVDSSMFSIPVVYWLMQIPWFR
jgi:phosphatidate cytidylyltransferase